MIQNLKPNFFYAGIFSILVASLISIVWTQMGNLTKPPVWALISGFFTFLIGILLIVYISVDIIKSFNLGKQVKTNFFMFTDFLKYVPEAKAILDQLKLNVQRRELILGTNHFESIMSEMHYEFKSLASKYFERKLKRFMRKVFFRGILGVILIFACFYIAEYSIEMYFWNQAGFRTGFLPGGNLFGFIVEGLYYSVTTFTTLGYGDICPTKLSIVARLISSFEVLMFVSFFAVFVNFGLNSATQRFVLVPDDMIDVMRAELETVDGGVRI